MSWRITYSRERREAHSAIDAKTGIVSSNTLFRASSPVELRDTDGTIVRLGPGAEFEIKDSPLGRRPEYYGPVFISCKGGCGKYRTSCWMGVRSQLSSRPDIFMRPGEGPNVDEFYAISGDIEIYEFDEESRTFTICSIHEGEKALIRFDPGAEKIRDRYSAQVMPFTDEEYGNILTKYIDRRNWV